MLGIKGSFSFTVDITCAQTPQKHKAENNRSNPDNDMSSKRLVFLKDKHFLFLACVLFYLHSLFQKYLSTVIASLS